jgi:colanic acid biosynthesis glycosyl transferase WcaI
MPPFRHSSRAAATLSYRSEIVFCFVGGGTEFGKVQCFARERRLGNILCLRYQPREALADSLSAADVHVVVLGDPFVGIVHPCKIYNVLLIGAPILYIGPSPSHITDITADSGSSIYLAEHGRPDQVILHIEDACARRARGVPHLLPGCSQKELLSKMCEVIEPAPDPMNDSTCAGLASR